MLSDNFIKAKEKLTVSQTFLIIAAWFLICFIWGSNWIFLKIALADLPPFTLAAMRVGIAAFVLTLIAVLMRASFPRSWRDWLLICTSGLLATGNYGLLAWGLQYVSAGLAAILNTTALIFSFLLAHLYLPDERLSSTKFFGIGLGVSGVVLIFFKQVTVDSSFAVWGATAILLSAFCMAYSNVLIKSCGGQIERLTLTAGQLWLGVVPLFLIGFITEGNPLNFRWTLSASGALFYLALVGSALALVVFYWLVRKIHVTKTMLILLVAPLVAVSLGIWLLDEILSGSMILGGSCIFAGVGLLVSRKKMKSETTIALEEKIPVEAAN